MPVKSCSESGRGEAHLFGAVNALVECAQKGEVVNGGWVVLEDLLEHFHGLVSALR